LYKTVAKKKKTNLPLQEYKKKVVQNKYEISSNCFIKFIIIPDVGPKGAKHVGVVILKYIQKDAT
jgi:hypothetical protein